MNTKEFLKAINILEVERGISKEIVIAALKEALEKAYKKNYDTEADVEVIIDQKNGELTLIEKKIVVDNLEDEEKEIFIDEARETHPNCEVGDIIEINIELEDFGRLAATHAKGVVRQKIREAEKTIVYDEYIKLKDDIIMGVVDRVEPQFTIINLGKTSAILHAKNMIKTEKLREGQSIKVYITDVEKGGKGAQVITSRVDPGFVRRLFEAEVPEIYNGIVEIKSIAREAGDRSKIAVCSSDDTLDAVGACVGPKGSRVNAIVNELKGEKIDIVEWSASPITYITNALAPSLVLGVKFDETTNSAIVVVPDDQLSLAIGKKGQNARLAVRLTGYKIDIKSKAAAIEEGIEFEYNGNATNQEVINEFAKKSAPKVFDFEQEEYTIVTETPEPVVEEVLVEEVAEVKEVEIAPTIKVVKKEEKVADDVITVTPEIIEALLEAKKAPVIEAVKVTEEHDLDYLPKYSEVELLQLEEDEELSKYDEDIDYDEYDAYYN